ncbi:glycosyltransferase family 8 protein [Daedalea quercina L-15889]|uniref:Glycosyltransferase family 8 protein n=1 Tax=Daedalea quercina L-15889 TaxID=1314783 RepID=A0A165NEB3_9APHY|nr:glycosyltransferase family 8 protein [Daedalea quercina L-15889]
MSFQRSYLDTSPTMSTPPPSPWRTRAEQIRRRPIRLRQAALILTAFGVLCTFILLSRQHPSNASTYDNWIVVEDRRSPLQPLPPNQPQQLPSLQNGHDHKPQHDSGRSPNLIDDHALAPEANIPKVHGTHVNAVAAAPEPIVFSLIMFSEDSANEGAILMKSILMYSSKPVEFHIICDEVAETYLGKRIRLVERPAHNILVRFYRLSLDDMRARIEREGGIMTDHSAGTRAGLMKLFIHEILPESVSRAIFVDTDAFFISDPALLWDRFDGFKPATAVAMPSHPDQSSEEWHNANRICSCIMLLDLARLRALRLMDSSAYRAAGAPALAPARFEAMFGAPGDGGKYQGVKLGDQGYWWAIVSQTPDIFEHLSYDWEMSSCLMDMYGTGLGDDVRDMKEEARSHVHTWDTPHVGQAVLPKLLHFNCLDAVSYYEWKGWTDPQNSLAQRWAPAVQYHVGFKWIWLNAHRPLGTLTVETEKVIFADELFAARHERKAVEPMELA